MYFLVGIPLWADGGHHKVSKNCYKIKITAGAIFWIFQPACSRVILISEPVLIAPDFQKQFKLAIDASDIGCGGVLMQVGEDGIDHPISYFSKTFDKHQRNYSTIEKECLALILALEHFDVYLGTTVHPVLVFTDHNPLTFIRRMKNKNQRLVRWSLTLQEYNLDIRHIKGKDNVMADALSRVA